MEIKIGADPEFFLRRNGELVSAHGMVPGTKEAPHKVDGGAIQVDGMALEFNINPATTNEEFVDNIQTVLKSFREYLPAKEGWEFDFSPVAEFGADVINAQPKAARILGCEPDYNAWTGGVNPKPDADMPFRTASGHIHIGWTEDEDALHPEHFEACTMLTKQLDLFLPPVFKFLDLDTKRRELYGQLGAFRPKSYGVEYRVLSNHWLTSPKLMEMVFDLTKVATEQLLEGNAKFREYSDPSFIYGSDTWEIQTTWNHIYYILRTEGLGRKWSRGATFDLISHNYNKLHTESIERQQKLDRKKPKDGVPVNGLIRWGMAAAQPDIENNLLDMLEDHAPDLNRLVGRRVNIDVIDGIAARPWRWDDHLPEGV